MICSSVQPYFSILQHAAEISVMLVTASKYETGICLYYDLQACFLMQSSNRRETSAFQCGIHTKSVLTIFKTTLHKLLGLYHKIQLLSATNTDTPGLNSPFLSFVPLSKGREALGLILSITL